MILLNERRHGAGPGGRGGVAVKNGTLGTVAAIEAGGERLTVRLDGAGGQAGAGGAVTFYLRDYGHLDHGYAATVHKAQGVTVDRAHVLAGPGMDRHTAYVALTRHRDGVALHWSREAMGSREGLTKILSRERAKDTSLDYAGPEVVAAFAERRGLHPLAPAGDIAMRRPKAERKPGRASPSREKARESVRRALGWHEEDKARWRDARAADATRVRAEPAREAPPAPMLPAFQDPWGRDSQGRGTAPADLAAAAERDRRVQGHAADRVKDLRDAYRDPAEAGRRLHAVIAREGGDLRRAAAVLDGEGLEILGALRGREGWFATAGAKEERWYAVRGAKGLAPSLRGEADDRERAVRDHVRAVEAQRGHDAVAVPGLSQAAWDAVRAVETARERGAAGAKPGEESWRRAAREREVVADAWEREVALRPEVAAELRAFRKAVRERFGHDAHGDARLQRPEAKPDTPEAERPREGLAGVARAFAAERLGRGAHEDRQRAVERQREAERERQSPHQGRGMRM
jgi:hypothetical protein